MTGPRNHIALQSPHQRAPKHVIQRGCGADFVGQEGGDQIGTLLVVLVHLPAVRKQNGGGGQHEPPHQNIRHKGRTTAAGRATTQSRDQTTCATETRHITTTRRRHRRRLPRSGTEQSRWPQHRPSRRTCAPKSSGRPSAQCRQKAEAR